MADDVALYWSLFQGQFPGQTVPCVGITVCARILTADEWRTEPGFVQYLSQLSSLSAEKLRELHNTPTHTHTHSTVCVVCRAGAGEAGGREEVCVGLNSETGLQ